MKTLKSGYQFRPRDGDYMHQMGKIGVFRCIIRQSYPILYTSYTMNFNFQILFDNIKV